MFRKKAFNPMCSWQVIFLGSGAADEITLALLEAIAKRGVESRQMTERVKHAADIACFRTGPLR